jgi:hypothetical protein
MYLLRRELKQIWILYAWYSLVSYFSHTSIINFICFKIFASIRFKIFTLKKINNFNSRFWFSTQPSPQLTDYCLLPSFYCPLSLASATVHCQQSTNTVHCPLSTVRCPLSTVHCPLSTVYCPLPLPTVCIPLLTAHCSLPTVYCPLSTA